MATVKTDSIFFVLFMWPEIFLKRFLNYLLNPYVGSNMYPIEWFVNYLLSHLCCSNTCHTCQQMLHELETHVSHFCFISCIHFINSSILLGVKLNPSFNKTNQTNINIRIWIDPKFEDNHIFQQITHSKTGSKRHYG